MAIVAIVAIVAIEDGGLARGGLGWARWRLPICVGLMVAPLLYRLLCYIGSFAIYIMCGVFGEGIPLHA